MESLLNRKVDAKYSQLTPDEQKIARALAKTSYAFTIFDVLLIVADDIVAEKKKNFSLMMFPKREAQKKLRELSKEGFTIPAYTTIQKVVKEFERMKLLSKRKTITGHKGFVYYVPENVRAAISA